MCPPSVTGAARIGSTRLAQCRRIISSTDWSLSSSTPMSSVVLPTIRKPPVVESFVTALDLMYFWYYQPCAQQTLTAYLKKMSREERAVFARFQGILLNVQEVCQLFVDGMLGTNFSQALSFYLNNYEEYLETVASLSASFDVKKR